MRHATFRQLQVFEAVARHGSFTRAAEELGLAQPTVSMQIKKLTEEIGMPLFSPLGKGVRLTEVGHSLQIACRDIFNTLDRFERGVINLRGLHSGTLRLAVVNTANTFAPLLLSVFCKRHPGIRAALEIGHRDQMLRRLAANQDDLYIMSRPPTNDSARALPILSNPLVVVAPIDHALVGKPAVMLEDLVREPFLLREPASGIRHTIEEFLAARGLSLQVRMEMGDDEAIKQAIQNDMGIAIMSRYSLGPDPAAARLAILDAQDFPLTGHWYAVVAENKPLSPVAQAFLEFLQQEGPAIVNQQQTPN